MKIVIDGNRVIAALIRESTTRKIIFDKNFEFITPDFILSEIDAHKELIIEKSSVSENEFHVLLSLVFEHITIIPQNEYIDFVREISDEIKDPNDIFYLAVCIASKAEGIWTHDPHFKEQKKVKVFTNIDMLGFC